MPHALPLDGIRILDLTRLLPGPFCSQILGDFGADVVKVEDTGVGDLVRIMPPYVGSESALFLAVNRNKRGIALNLKHEAGKEALRRLARRADVVLDGFRPGVMERLGLGFESLRRENRGLVYCAITGYGQDGPWRDRAGHDLNYVAMAGILGMTGVRGGPPVPPGIQVADFTSALWAALGILLALRAREKSGLGQLVDMSMLDGVLALLSIHAGAALAGDPPRRGEHWLSGGRPGYAVYETRDGRHLALGAVEPKFWEAFCRALGHEEWIVRQAAEGEDAARAQAEVAAVVRTRPLSEWLLVLEKVETCATPVLSIEEALDGEQARARGMRRAMPHPTLGLIPQLGPGVRLCDTPAELRRPPPSKGEHTDEVLRDVGFSSEEIEAMRAAGAVA